MPTKLLIYKLHKKELIIHKACNLLKKKEAVLCVFCDYGIIKNKNFR